MIIWRNVLTLVEIAAGYGLLCVCLPSLCLRDFVQDKPLTYRFIFYQVCANMYLILWGFVLAFLKSFNTITLWLTLVLLPLAATAWRKRETVTVRFLAARETAETILTGMYGMHALWRNLILSLRRRCRRIYCRYIKGHVWELLGICAMFALVLFLYGQYHLTTVGFAYGDENVHFYWEKELLHGNPFPSGMYPHGMHFLVASLSGMFGITISRAALLIGIFNDCLLFCMLYLVLKETFSSRTAVLFGIGFFLTTNMFERIVWWRYQSALPMEMGLIPYCTMFYALRRYVDSRDGRDWLLAVLSLGWCIHIHFYVAILAALTCVAFGIAFLMPILKKKILHWLIIGGLVGSMLGCMPFGLGYVLGYPFERSMGWALGVIQEESEAINAAMALTELSQSEAENEVIDAGTVFTMEEFLDEAFFWSVKNPAARIVLLILDMIVLLWGLLGAVFSRKDRLRCLMILFYGLTWVVGLVISTGVIPLFDRGRFSVFFGFMSTPLFVLPAQFFHDTAVLMHIRPKYAEMSLTVVVLTFFFFMARGGYVRDDFAVETGIIEEGDMETGYRLMDEYPNQTWTIVSTTYDLNFVRYYGYHTEIIDLIKHLDARKGSLHLPLDEDHIYVPTKDIFVVVETKIDQYDERSYFRNSHIGGGGMLENRGDPTPELALTDLPETDLLNDVHIYFYPWRKVVMSKLYYWMEKVKETYPNEVSVFYQDEVVTVYHIRQDEYFPLDLMLDYQSDLR